MNPFSSFMGLEDAQMKARIVALEDRLRSLECSVSHNAEANKRVVNCIVKIHQILKDMGAAINRILGRMEG